MSLETADAGVPGDPEHFTTGEATGRHGSLFVTALRAGTRGMLLGWIAGALLGLAASRMKPNIDVLSVVVLGTLMLGFVVLPVVTTMISVARVLSAQRGVGLIVRLRDGLVASGATAFVWGLGGGIVVSSTAQAAGIPLLLRGVLPLTIGYASTASAMLWLIVTASRLRRGRRPAARNTSQAANTPEQPTGVGGGIH